MEEGKEKQVKASRPRGSSVKTNPWGQETQEYFAKRADRGGPGGDVKKEKGNGRWARGEQGGTGRREKARGPWKRERGKGPGPTPLQFSWQKQGRFESKVKKTGRGKKRCMQPVVAGKMGGKCNRLNVRKTKGHKKKIRKKRGGK